MSYMQNKLHAVLFILFTILFLTPFVKCVFRFMFSKAILELPLFLFLFVFLFHLLVSPLIKSDSILIKK